MLYPCKSGWNLPTSPWDIVHTSTFWLKFGISSPALTLKIRSRSPKPNQLFKMSQCYIHANLVKIHPSVHEISCKQENVKLTPTLTPTGSAPKTICPLPFGGGINKRHICLYILSQPHKEDIRTGGRDRVRVEKFFNFFNTSTKGHKYKLCKKSCRIDVRKYTQVA